ncbi:Modification methylase MboII [Campylobacter upsaliensis]|uniref:Modification methylase MboII n=1 Tax=Campylobacter upsaliensis TaxID=28080 RepID=A0A381EJH1_CAMUP|nr:Modification methylase MboII [Campylobacter upsaliensis]
MDRIIAAKNEKSGSFYIFNTPYHCALFLHYLQEKAVFQNSITWYKKDGLSTTKKRFVNNQESILHNGF